MRTGIYLLLAAFSLFFISSCKSEDRNPETKEVQKDTVTRKPRPGDVKDEHGCMTSAGYIWSAARNECIRLWEVASEVEATNRSEFVVHVLVTDDKSKAEVFIPEEGSIVLNGNGNDTYSNDSLTLLANGKNFVLKQNGKAIFQTASVPVEPEAKPVRRKRRR